jgi:topoisomerase-4 subunit A
VSRRKATPQPEFDFDAGWSRADSAAQGASSNPAQAAGGKETRAEKRRRRLDDAATPAATASAAPPTPPPTPPPEAAPLGDGGGLLRRLMDTNFLSYASYVICDRAIPHLDDGLKPVQRRILHSLHERDDGRFTKVANIVGHCMQYHPHGDASIGDALVNLVNKACLIEGQGNFGNPHTGDPAAAPRYIECRLTDLARKHVFQKDLTEFVPSYDGRNQEPVTLPARLPLLLMLGAEGIAVGLSTRIFPHNFRELIEAEIAVLQGKPFRLLPAFPEGGLMDVSEYEDGAGRLKLRAHIETDPHRQRLVVRELPHGQTTESLIASIEDAAQKKKVPVRAINDFTAGSVEIELLLSPGTAAEDAIRALYAFTACETPVSSRVVVIHGRRPRDMTVSEVLRENVAQLQRLLKRELEIRAARLREELHAKTLVEIFIENRIYKRIEKCATYEAVQQAVLDGLAPFRERLSRDVTLEDVEMLLGIRIRRISLFDLKKSRAEREAIVKDLAATEKNLRQLVPYCIRYLKDILKEHGDAFPRRTRIERFEAIERRELSATEVEILWDREGGYVGTAVKGEPVLKCSSYDRVILVWSTAAYKAVSPPEKLFADQTLLYCGRADRDQVFTAVYRAEGITFLKRFTFGGTILNKDYRCAPDGAELLLFREGTPEEIYVRYKPAKGQRIRQQVFCPQHVAVRGVKTRGNQMSAKAVERITAEKPRWWSDEDAGPQGRLI